ncbi:MAG: choice-of-anchor D domain-containing protein [Silvibacterium sp.]
MPGSFPENSLQIPCKSRRSPLKALLALLVLGVIPGCGVEPHITATPATSSGSVTISPTSLSFAIINVGSSSASQSVTISNGTSSSVTLSAGTLSGTNPGDFSISSTTCGSSLAASANCTASILFKPTATGSRSATYSITDSASTTPLTAALSGTGTTSSGGTATASPSSIIWGSVPVGQASGQKMVTLTNTGSGSITIGSISFSGADTGDFAIFQSTCGSTLAASASCTASILFKPTAAGTRTATLVFADSAGDSPQDVSLSGTATGSASGSVTISPASLTFTGVSVGSSSTSQSVIVSNGTSSSVTLSAGTFSGTNAGDFSVSSTTCGSSVAASASCTASILFKPTATGARSATYSITDSASTTPLAVSLSGTGTSPGSVTISPTSLSFASINVGSSSSTQSITVKNGTSSSVTLSAGMLSGTNPGDFSVSSTTCGSSLAASASCTASILFKPAAAGTRSATYSITDSASTTPLTVSLSGTGTTSSGGTGTASPSSLIWGSVAVGSAGGPKPVTLTNTGSSSITISGISFIGADAGDFSVYQKTCGSSLAASASCTATILFKPTAAGTRTATLVFADSAGDSPQDVSLSGTATGTSSGSVTISPASLPFASITVGSSSASQSVTITNGTASSVTLSAGTFSGTNAGDFAISSTTCGSSLAASASCTASLLFKPTATGARSATYSITDSASTTPLTVALSGTGTSAGSVTISPTSLSFASINVGSSSSSQSVTITNGSSSSVTLSAGTLSGTNAGDFSVSSTTCASSLAASASCTASLLFKPTATGARSATYSITDSASTTPLTVALSGTGTSSGGTANASPSSLTWGSVAVGSAGGPKPVTLTNSGTSAITISDISFTGTNAGDFSVYQNTCGSSLAASASCIATILFKPTVAGTRTATLVFTDSAGNSPQDVSLSGTATGTSSGSVTISPTSLSFASITVGSSSASQSVTVSNGTSSSVTLSAGTLSGTNPGDFSVSSTTCGSSLAASASCSASLLFKPTATGARSATYGITDSASTTPLTVALSGTGTSSGTVTISPTSLPFGSVNIGSSSAAQSVTVSNGTANSVTLSAGTLAGTNPGDFSVSSTTCGSSLAESASCTASLLFKPTAAGARSATYSITDSASTTPLTVALSGTGVTSSGGTATASPSSLSFGSIAVNGASGQRYVTLTNNGSSTISISGRSITGADPTDFTITANACGTSLAPSKSCYVTLLFQPTTTGARTATLNLVDGASNSPQTVPLSGTGTPAPTATVTISPSGLSWGSQTVGSTAASKTFTLTSGGSGSVSISSIAFAGTDPGDFSITGKTCGSTLAASSSCTVTVAFKPAAIGNRVALLSVTDDAIASPQTAGVSGAGAYSTAQSASVTVDFGSRSGSQVAIPARMLGVEYLESLPTNANRATVVQGGFTAARYHLELPNVYPTTTPNWNALNSDMSKLAAAGVNPIIDLVDTPSFLQPSSGGCPAAPITDVPADLNGWGQLAAAIVAHLDATFPGLAQDYEIWNEPTTTALCSSNKFNDYVSIYAAAAPLMKAQAKTDGVTIHIGGPAGAGVSFPNMLFTASVDPYIDFYSYHRYLANTTDINNGMTWDGAGGTPSMRAKILDPSQGMQAYYLAAYNAVKAAKTPLGAKTPIYFDEYNDDWALEPDCCRNSPIYSPLFNSMTIAQILNSAYKGAAILPTRMIYFAAAQQAMCVLGVVDAAMDCTKAATGAQAQPYPQWYTYELIFAPSFLDLEGGGYMATSVTLSSGASGQGLIATAYYTSTTDSILVINPTSSSFSGVTVQINSNGLSSPTSTLYTINEANPHVSSWPASTISASGGIQTTFDLPSYSVVAISLKN